MMARKLRPWLPLVAASSVVVAFAVAHRVRPHATPPASPDPNTNRPNVPPSMKVSYLETSLHAAAPDLRVVRSAFCFVVTPDVDPATLGSLPPTEEYADCWRGVVLCEPDQPALEDGPHALRVGDFRLFGDVELLQKVRPAAETVHFGPYRETP